MGVAVSNIILSATQHMDVHYIRVGCVNTPPMFCKLVKTFKTSRLRLVSANEHIYIHPKDK